MTYQVEVRACKEIEAGDGGTAVTWCSFPDAEFLGVYIGWGGEMVWVADFNTDYIELAVQFCTDYAVREGATFTNRIGEI